MKDAISPATTVLRRKDMAPVGQDVGTPVTMSLVPMDEEAKVDLAKCIPVARQFSLQRTWTKARR